MAKIEFNQKISGQLAFSVILILSLAVAWFSVYAGGEIIKNAKTSPEFNLQVRMENAKINK